MSQMTRQRDDAIIAQTAYAVLDIHGKPMIPIELARACGVSVRDLRHAVSCTNSPILLRTQRSALDSKRSYEMYYLEEHENRVGIFAGSYSTPKSVRREVDPEIRYVATISPLKKEQVSNYQPQRTPVQELPTLRSTKSSPYDGGAKRHSARGEGGRFKRTNQHRLGAEVTTDGTVRFRFARGVLSAAEWRALRDRIDAMLGAVA